MQTALWTSHTACFDLDTISEFGGVGEYPGQKDLYPLQAVTGETPGWGGGGGGTSWVMKDEEETWLSAVCEELSMVLPCKDQQVDWKEVQRQTLPP